MDVGTRAAAGPEGLKQSIAEHMCSVTGGGCTCTGDDLALVHAGLGIREADFRPRPQPRARGDRRGVEDEASLALLRQWGCDLARGYFMSRPLAPAAFANWFHERAGRFALPVPAVPARVVTPHAVFASPG